MSNDLESAANNFSEQSKKLQIAMYYTYGDDDKARKMLTGSYLDLFVIKGRFSSSSVYGAFILFFNLDYFKLVHSYSIACRSDETGDVKTSKDWRNFEKEIFEINKAGNLDEVFKGEFSAHLNKIVNMKEFPKLIKLMGQDDGIAVNHEFQRLLTDLTGYQSLDVSIDYEKISSLTMEMCSSTSSKISAADLAKGRAKQLEPEIKIEKLDDPLEGKDVKLVLNGALILSPIKGKDIASLVEGDRIKISLVDNNPKAIEVARAFDAYDESGKFKPITGRIISRKHDGAYTFFAIVARGIYVKIVEEEDRIKVSMDPSFYSNTKAGDSGAGAGNSLSLIVSGLVFIVLIAVVLYFVMAG